MNKTISINLNGMLFYLEEGAYNRLFQYLKNIRSNFDRTEGCDEIIQDIEARIAELFAQFIKTKQVILENEVNEVIAIMGEPEIYKNEEDASENPKGERIDKETVKRLFRDSDDAVLGGVCSGIGYYFGIDPVWLRLAFVIALFLAGSGPLLYIILWIVIPKANTTAEKLQMRGEKVNIENIERRIREEAKIFKERAQAFGEDASKGFRKANVHGRLGEFIQEISGIIFNTFRRILLFMGRSIGVISGSALGHSIRPHMRLSLSLLVTRKFLSNPVCSPPSRSPEGFPRYDFFSLKISISHLLTEIVSLSITPLLLMPRVL